jgi:AcrR family transcriptional regulator
VNAKSVSHSQKAVASVKPMRADAQRNREMLLTTARELFSAGQIHLRMEDIAKRAGVGIGTLYRHFETREALIEAVYRQEIESLRVSGPALLGEMSASEALATFLYRLVDRVADNRGLATALNAVLTPDSTASTEGSRQLLETITLLLNAGVDEKSLRADVAPTSILVVICGLCAAQGHFGWKRQAQDVVSLLLDGLRFGIVNREGHQHSRTVVNSSEGDLG